jgi:phosphopantothenoylcysteine decarboxylase/phosphopantothenate--cysteine ligase
MNLQGKQILLGVTGGVAAFKAAFLARELQRRGANVQVAMTEAATHFVGPASFQALTGQPVFTDQWDTRIDNGMAHIELSRSADALLIAPASADFIAKLANGLCDDLLSTLCLARDCPLAIAPAMNRQMWAHPATQRNVARLRNDGVTIFGPDSGDQACGETGDGRMLEAEVIAEALDGFFVPKRLAGRRVLITAGPTFEPIDPVRGITNLSSGRMGFAVARACQQAGAEVTLVAGPVALSTPFGVTRIDVTTAQEMHRAVFAELELASDTFANGESDGDKGTVLDPSVAAAAAAADYGAAGAPSDLSAGRSEEEVAAAAAADYGSDGVPKRNGFDAFIAVAAVADWRVANRSASKLKKTEGGAPPTLEFAQNPDILAEVARRADAPYCVGFAAESEDLEANGAAKRERKGVPLLVANIGHETFGSDENELLLIDASGSRKLSRASKVALAAALASELAARLARERP